MEGLILLLRSGCHPMDDKGTTALHHLLHLHSQRDTVNAGAYILMGCGIPRYITRRLSMREGGVGGGRGRVSLRKG